jgi:4-alpha-glucanotransferase
LSGEEKLRAEAEIERLVAGGIEVRSLRSSLADWPMPPSALKAEKGDCPRLAVAPLQDLLNLGPEGRMNVPGRPQGNWTWRCTEAMLSVPAFQSLRELTRSSNRTGVPASPSCDREEAES